VRGPVGCCAVAESEPSPLAKGLPTADVRAVVGRHVFDGTFPLPVAVLRDSALSANIATMARFAEESGSLLAPHAKTTMSPQIVGRQRAAGAWGMTTATAWQTARVAGMGVDRIVLASQVTDAGSLRLLQDLLDAQPSLVVWAYADSAESLTALDSIEVARPGSLRVLLELGFPGGRTGVRSQAQARDLALLVARRRHPLAGVAAFEGTISGPDLPATISRVDDFLGSLGALAADLAADGLLATDEPILTVGGSSFPDRAVAVLGGPLERTGLRLVLRSGCYVTHDHGAYAATSPFGDLPRAALRLTPAIEVWGSVLSRPEADLALVGVGRRDVSYDAGLPVVVGRRRAVEHDGPAPVVTALNDQHAYLRVDPADPLGPGDLVAFGISHPCTTFDKWQAMPIVDDNYVVVDVATTAF
jgi:D-serine dehydratase